METDDEFVKVIVWMDRCVTLSTTDIASLYDSFEAHSDFWQAFPELLDRLHWRR